MSVTVDGKRLERVHRFDFCVDLINQMMDDSDTVKNVEDLYRALTDVQYKAGKGAGDFHPDVVYRVTETSIEFLTHVMEHVFHVKGDIRLNMTPNDRYNICENTLSENMSEFFSGDETIESNGMTITLTTE